MAKLALYEPPYCAPKTPDDYLDRLKELIAADRREDAVTLFWKEYVRFPDELIEGFRQQPSWATFEALAPTIIYDGIIGNDHASIPFDLLPKISVPTMVFDGGIGPAWQREACEAIANGIPGGGHRRLEGATHLFSQKELAPLLAEFFSS